jgi:hypothetical protein
MLDISMASQTKLDIQQPLVEGDIIGRLRRGSTVSDRPRTEAERTRFSSRADLLVPPPE